MAKTKKTVRVRVANKRKRALRRNVSDYVITPQGLGVSRTFKVWSKKHGDLGTFPTHPQAAKVVADLTRAGKAADLTRKKNPSGKKAKGKFKRRNKETQGKGSTRTEVRSPTSTEVRSPTKTSTSTDAYTAGNVTVTGGAGRGAATRVTIHQHKLPDDANGSKRSKGYSPTGFAAMGFAERKNPGTIATLSYGTTIAEITKKGNQYLAEVKQKGKVAVRKAWNSLRDAMEWARSKVFETKNPKNPVDSAEKMFEMFHGYPSKQVLEYVEREHRHSVLAGLGTLIEMHVLNVAGTREAILKAPDPETAPFADVIQVAVSEDGKQLYLVGGDQKIPLKTLESEFGMTSVDVRDKMLIGTITRLTYRTVKSFEAKGRKEVDFYHDLGKESSKGICPVMEYKPRNPSIEIVGGRYHIAPGERFLKGVSPGIVG